MKRGLGKRKICAVCTGVELGGHTDCLPLSPFPLWGLVLQVILWWPHFTGMAQMSPLPNMFADGLSKQAPIILLIVALNCVLSFVYVCF